MSREKPQLVRGKRRCAFLHLGRKRGKKRGGKDARATLVEEKKGDAFAQQGRRMFEKKKSAHFTLGGGRGKKRGVSRHLLRGKKKKNDIRVGT